MFIVIGVVIVELVKEIPGQVFAEALWQQGQPHGEGGQGTGGTPCGNSCVSVLLRSESVFSLNYCKESKTVSF